MSYSAPQAHLKWQVPPTDAQIESSDLDSAGSSHGGDEFEPIPDEWEPDAARRVADTRCARCSEGDDFALLVSGMDDALLKLSNGLLFERRQMMLDALNDLMSVRQAMTEAL